VPPEKNGDAAGGVPLRSFFFPSQGPEAPRYFFEAYFFFATFFFAVFFAAFFLVAMLDLTSSPRPLPAAVGLRRRRI
jgi:hypothetical protein